jgi:hypothetical protein
MNTAKPALRYVMVLVALTSVQPHAHSAEDDNRRNPALQEESTTPQNGPSGDAGAAVAPTVNDRIAPRKDFTDALCRAIGQEASANNLPAEFFTRLIWQESRFNPAARSHKGAEGIAQFMPGTARWRGLADSYEPFPALRESARWLAELREQFGNLGLAAAAYNAGPGRVRRWLSGLTSLPSETRHYVWVITGRSVDDWSRQGVKDSDSLGPKVIPCIEIARLFAPSGRPPIGIRVIATAATGPWGLQLVGDWSENRALADYRKLQQRFPAILGDKQPLVLRGKMAGRGSAVWYRIRVAESTRQRAHELCIRLESAGGKCLVFRN